MRFLSCLVSAIYKGRFFVKLHNGPLFRVDKNPLDICMPSPASLAAMAALLPKVAR